MPLPSLHVCSVSAFTLLCLPLIVFAPVGQFQPNFTELWMIKPSQGLWKQPRPRSEWLPCNRYSCYPRVTHLCRHLLQLHLARTEHQNRERLRNTMVKMARSFSEICSPEQRVSLVTFGMNHKQVCSLQWNYPTCTVPKLRPNTAFTYI